MLVSQSKELGKTLWPGPGIVLECTDRGTILKLQRDDLGLLQGIAPGVSFYHLLDIDSLNKGHLFLSELQERASAFGIDLKVHVAHKPITLFFGGMVTDGLLLIFAAQTRAGLLRFSRFFLGKEQFKAKEKFIREQIGLFRIQDNRESDLDEKLDRANNEVQNLRRALARKNNILRQVIAELRAVRAGAHTMKGLLPICSSCKRIRDLQDSWTQIETFFKDQAGVQFTHTICPDCIQHLYPGLRIKK
ncbi:MAG: hypothetical protein ACOZFS_05210 [Thermodesulfobacteriota bacterium]